LSTIGSGTKTFADADRAQALHRLAGRERSVRPWHARPHPPRCRATARQPTWGIAEEPDPDPRDVRSTAVYGEMLVRQPPRRLDQHVPNHNALRGSNYRTALVYSPKAENR
jgi:hypothetical protein